MPHEFTLQRMVEFAETDMAGIMHFSNYFRYMEATEHAFFRSLGLTVHEHAGGAMTGWARVHAECSYRRPLRYQDVVDVRLRVAEKKPKSITYAFVFGTAAEPDLARGSVTTVCVAREPGEEGIRSIEMPPEVWERIEAAPPEALDEGTK